MGGPPTRPEVSSFAILLRSFLRYVSLVSFAICCRYILELKTSYLLPLTRFDFNSHIQSPSRYAFSFSNLI